MSFFDKFYQDEINRLKMRYKNINNKVDELESHTGMSIDGINEMLKNGWQIEWKAGN